MNFLFFISLFAQRNEAKKVSHESQPKAFLGAQPAPHRPENFRFAPFVDYNKLNNASVNQRLTSFFISRVRYWVRLITAFQTNTPL